MIWFGCAGVGLAYLGARMCVAIDDTARLLSIWCKHGILSFLIVFQTFKMKFGNRGMNQPCIDMRTAKCYITPQNHG